MYRKTLFYTGRSGMLQVYLFWFLLSYTMQQEAGVSGSAPLIHTHHGHMPAISILSDSCERGVWRKNVNRAAGVGPNISINTPSKRLLKKPPKPGASWPYFMQGVDKRWLLVVWWEAIHNSRRQMKRLPANAPVDLRINAFLAGK